jgi:hypothetical protein
VLLKVLEQTDALSQVSFVHDYIQLIFQDYVLNLYNPVWIKQKSYIYKREEPNFCDAMVSLIGLKVVNVFMVKNEILSLHFESDISVSVSLLPKDAVGPEAFQFKGPNALLVVEQNT